MMYVPGEFALGKHRVDEVHLAESVHVHVAQVQRVLDPMVLLVSAKQKKK